MPCHLREMEGRGDIFAGTGLFVIFIRDSHHLQFSKSESWEGDNTLLSTAVQCSNPVLLHGGFDSPPPRARSLVRNSLSNNRGTGIEAR